MPGGSVGQTQNVHGGDQSGGWGRGPPRAEFIDILQGFRVGAPLPHLGGDFFVGGAPRAEVFNLSRNYRGGAPLPQGE